MFGQHPAPSVFHMWGLGGSITAPHVEPGETPHAWLQIMVVNNGVVMARDVYVNFRMAGPGVDGFWSLREPPSRWQLTESIGGWHAVADDRFRLAPSACIPVLSPMLYLKPPFVQDLWYEITLGCSGSPVHMFEHCTAYEG